VHIGAVADLGAYMHRFFRAADYVVGADIGITLSDVCVSVHVGMWVCMLAR